jgi:hypothetical protein
MVEPLRVSPPEAVAYPLGQNNINIINRLPFYHSLWGDLGNLSSCRQVIPPIQAVERRGRVGEEGLCLGEGFRKSQIPPDLVVKSQAIDIIGLILSLIRRKTSSTTSRRPRKSSFELLSLSEGHWFTT